MNRKPKSKSKKLPSLASLKRKCDKAFSIYIRTRDIDRNGNTSCVTCGSTMHWKQIQCGHFISRNYLSLRFDDVNGNCQPQCVACNIFKKGAYPEFAVYLEQEYGHGTIQKLLNMKHETVKYTRADYEQLITKFTGGSNV